MKAKSRILLALTMLLAIAFVVGYNYVYRSHRDISKESVAYKLTAKELHGAFTNDEEKATETYLNQVIQVNGILTGLNRSFLILEDAVFFELDERAMAKAENQQVNTEIVVKGRCIGYDNLLEEVKLDQTTILNNQP